MERASEHGEFTLVKYTTTLVAEALRRENVRQLKLTRLSELEIDAVGYRIAHPDQMPADFDQRAADAYARNGVPTPTQQL